MFTKTEIKVKHTTTMHFMHMFDMDFFCVSTLLTELTYNR